MFNFAYDRDAAVLVLALSGAANSDDDYTRLLEALRRLDADSLNRFDSPAATVLVVAPENPAPTAVWRKRIGEQWSSMRAPHHAFALVTTSSVIRGVLTAVNWFAPANDRRVISAHATFDAAVAWMEARRSRDVRAILTGLHARAQTDLPRGARVG